MDMTTAFVVWATSLIGYPLIALLVASAIEEGAPFWPVLGVLLVLRALFWLVEFLGDVLTWNLFRRRIFIRKAIECLRMQKFPMRKYSHDAFDTYLNRIQDDDEYSEEVKECARKIHLEIKVAGESMSFWRMYRIWDCWNVALDTYSPPDVPTKLP